MEAAPATLRERVTERGTDALWHTWLRGEGGDDPDPF